MERNTSSLHSPRGSSPAAWSHFFADAPLLQPSGVASSSSSSGTGSRVSEWFAGQTVFITGVTGLLGKVVLHKLLSILPDPPATASAAEGQQAPRLLVLVRPKAGSKRGEGSVSGSVRFSREVLSSPPLHHLLTARPSLARYITVRDSRPCLPRPYLHTLLRAHMLDGVARSWDTN